MILTFTIMFKLLSQDQLSVSDTCDVTSVAYSALYMQGSLVHVLVAMKRS